MSNTLQCLPSSSATASSPATRCYRDSPHTPPRANATSRRGRNTDTDARASPAEESNIEYPFSHSTSLIEVLRDDEDHIDLEAEEAAYRAFDLDESDSSALGLSSRNSRPKLLGTGPGPGPGHRHRPPSSIFSHDIWVGENGDAEKDSSFARGVRIVGWTSVGDKRGGAYVVYDCAILTHALTTIHIHKRYSAFLALHTTLLSSSSGLSRSARRHIPELPPRTALARFRPGFLESRRKALQAWLSTVLLHPEIGGCPAVREWVMAT